MKRVIIFCLLINRFYFSMGSYDYFFESKYPGKVEISFYAHSHSDKPFFSQEMKSSGIVSNRKELLKPLSEIEKISLRFEKDAINKIKIDLPPKFENSFNLLQKPEFVIDKFWIAKDKDHFERKDLDDNGSLIKYFQFELSPDGFVRVRSEWAEECKERGFGKICDIVYRK